MKMKKFEVILIVEAPETNGDCETLYFDVEAVVADNVGDGNFAIVKEISAREIS